MRTFKVLIIDDDVTTCDLLETILEMEDYQTASIHRLNRNEMVTLLDKEKPDILILDFHLGSQDTLSLITTIRQSVDWQHLPVLMTSAINHRQICLAAGATDFILKPFNLQSIINAVNKIRSGLLA
jgi:two-component system sensor histidine kinase ChiS